MGSNPIELKGHSLLGKISVLHSEEAGSIPVDSKDSQEERQQILNLLCVGSNPTPNFF